MKKTFLTTATALIAGLAFSLTAMAATSITTTTYNGVANYQVNLTISCTPAVFDKCDISYVTNNGFINFTDGSKTAISNMNLNGTSGEMKGINPQGRTPVLNSLSTSMLNPGTLTVPYSSGFTLTTAAGSAISVPLIDYNGNGGLTVLSGTDSFGPNRVTYTSTLNDNKITLNVSIQ